MKLRAKHVKGALLLTCVALIAACPKNDATTRETGAGGGTTSTTTVGQGAGGSGAGTGGGAGVGGNGPATMVRVVAANLSSGNQQSYDAGHGVRILRGLDADVILMQEMSFGNDGDAAMNTLVGQICDGCSYTRGPGAQHPNGIPNGIVTRLPILADGHWVDAEVDNRTFVWARLDVPGDRDLWAISVHLLSSNATSRNQEAQALLDYIQDNIPDDDYVVLGGDFNTNHRNELAVNTLASQFVTAGPHPRDQNGNDGTNEPRNRPYDWVVADHDLAPLQVNVVIGGNSFTGGTVIDTRVYTPLTDLDPAQAGDSGATGMQHMAVVRDFFFE